MPVTSLQAMCIGTCIDNIALVRDLGVMPFSTAEPILRCVTDADQLIEIQEHSPHLACDTADLWRVLIRRDFPNYSKNPIEPKNPLLWWKVYRKLKAEVAAIMAKDVAKLRNEMVEATKLKMETRVTFLPTVVASDQFVPGHRGKGGSASQRQHTMTRPIVLNRGRTAIQAVRMEAVQAKSAAMRQVEKSAAHWRSITGPKFLQQPQAKIPAPRAMQHVHQPAVPSINGAGVSRSESRRHFAYGARGTFGAQGSKQLAAYLHDNVDKTKRHKTVPLGEASPRGPITETYDPAIPPNKALSIRNSQASASASSSTASSPASQSLQGSDSTPELSLGQSSSLSTSSGYKMSLQEYSRKRKASALEESGS